MQAVLIPIADRHIDYCQGVVEKLKAEGLRVKIDDGGDRMNAKIRKAQLQKIPYMLVAGDKEVEAGTVAVRLRSGEDLKAKIHRRIPHHSPRRYSNSKVTDSTWT